MPTGERPPSAEQCSTGAAVTAGGRRGIALWWPSMGGYVGKAVAFADGGCTEVLVWHDGSFPFDGHCPDCQEERGPARLHLCVPEQWVQLGLNLSAAMDWLAP